MAIKPKPFKKVCTQCGWSKVYTPKSDCVDPSWGFADRKCPKCGCEDFKTEQLDPLSEILNFTKNLFKGKI